MNFCDIYFTFDVQFDSSVLKLKLSSKSIIPVHCREVNLDLCLNKTSKIKNILALCYNDKKYHEHINVMQNIIDKSQFWIFNFDKKRITECYHLTNLVFFGKKNILDAMHFLTTEEIYFELSVNYLDAWFC